MKKTKYSTSEYKAKLGPTLIIIGIIFYGIFLVFPTFLLVYYLIKRPSFWNIMQNDFWASILPFIPCIFYIYIIWIFYIFFSLIGKCLGKLKSLFNTIYYKNIENPYIYFRELPNNFGIGVTSLLFDSTLENEKDIVAVILDLCARKYLSLEYHGDKYTIHMLEKNPTNLLSNESYIFYALKRKTIKRINYKTWYNYCLEDGIALGLYTTNTPKNKKSINISETMNKFYKVLHIVLCILCISIIAFMLFKYSPFLSVLAIPFGLLLGKLFYAILKFIFSFVEVIFKIIFEAQNTIDEQYNKEISKNLKLTPKGINELNKLKSFKAFIKDFGNFADKYPEEIILWDRYLSYSQVFGLTKDIMKTGYSKLIKNSSFQIDDINNINFDNIEIL